MFNDIPLAANVAVFAVSAAVVWLAGARMVRYADAFAARTGIGRELLGMLLLGGVTSLPELAVACTASLSGVPALTVNDVLGSASINIVIIALADAVIGRDAITSVVASPGLLLQAVLGIVLLALVAAATVTFDVALFGVGAWSWLLVALYLLGMWMIPQSQASHAWMPASPPRASRSSEESVTQTHGSFRSLIAKTVVVGIAILAAGFLLAQTGAAIAEQTGLGASFVGAVFLAASTSLPEVSTVVAAVRLRRYEMALADVFGTNLFNVTIIFVADALYDGPPVLGEVGRFAGCSALLAIVLTALVLAGMIERRNRTLFRMGADSIAVLGCYAAGVAVLYQLR